MQWDTLWIHAQIATLSGDAPYGLIDDGAIAVKDNKVVWLGKTNDLPKPKSPAKKIIDVKRCLITPGLIDCHTHLVYAGNRANEFEQRLNGITYEEIAQQGGGIQATVLATREASEEALFEQSLARVKKLVAGGVSLIEIKSGYGLDLDTELKMLRVIKRLADTVEVFPTYLGAHTLPKEFRNNPDGYIDFVCEDVIPIVAKKGLARAVDAFCETIGFTTQQVERVFIAAHKAGLSVKLHAEQLHNLGGTRLAAKYKALSCDHLEYADESSVKAMAASGTTAVLLPGAFYFLRETQKPPIALLRRYNVPIAIATDSNPGSSPTTSLKLMMNMACTLFGLTVEEVLQAVTVNASRALGLPISRGQIQVGSPANFVRWAVNTPAELVYEF